MKNNLILILLFAASTIGLAQNNLKLHRVDISGGLFPLDNELMFIRPTQAIASHIANIDPRNATYSFFAGVSFLRIDRLEFGFEIGYQDRYLPTAINGVEVIGGPGDPNPMSAYRLMHRFRVQWFESEDGFFEMYSSLSAGVGFLHERGDIDLIYPAFNAHISAAGIRLGNKVSGFVEFGTGVKGLMLGGISYSP